MQKKLLTVAVAGVLAAPISAMAAVTVYGTIDTGIRMQTDVVTATGTDSVLLAVQGLDPARFVLHRRRASYRHLQERAESLLNQWSLADRAHHVTRQLSYGEQRQVELILALAGAPKVLLLDEPTAGLSPAETASVAQMIRRFSRETTILLIEHDMDVALDLVDRVTVLVQGRVLAEGTKDAIRSDPKVAAIYFGSDDA